MSLRPSFNIIVYSDPIRWPAPLDIIGYLHPSRFELELAQCVMPPVEGRAHYARAEWLRQAVSSE
ncbi:MAG: hypothetical protein NTW15_04185 [Burkholderiales bacterium]|nr:hypothetical protein [Burkholderiales bacterium]